MLLKRAMILHRMREAYGLPNNEGARLRAAGRVLRHELLTRRLGRPIVVPIGSHSKIIARKGETNSPKAVRANPPNDEMKVWRVHLRPGDLFVDVGANIGIYTVFALDLGAEVISVEPTANADRVHEQLRLNGYSATVLQQAITDVRGTVRMTTGLDSYNHLLLDEPGGVEVPATTLDEVLGDRTAAGVKIDVEGAERLVLQGARRALAEGRIRLLRLEWAPGCAAETLGEGRDPVAALLAQHACAPGVQLDPRLLDTVGAGR